MPYADPLGLYPEQNKDPLGLFEDIPLPGPADRPPGPGITAAPSPVAPAYPLPEKGVAAPLVTDFQPSELSQEIEITSETKYPQKPLPSRNFYDRAIPVVTRAGLKLLAPGMPKDIQAVWQKAGEGLLNEFVMGAVSVPGTIGAGADWMFDSEIGRDLHKKTSGWIKEKHKPEHDTFAHSVARGFGSLASFWIPGVGVQAGASLTLAKVAPKLATWFGAGTMAVLESMSEAGSVYEQSKGEGKGENEANRAAQKTFFSNLPLIAITNKLGFFGEKGGPLRKGLMSAITEGTQEGSQEIISAAAQGKDIRWKDVATSVGVGAITGGPLGAVTPSIQAERGVTERPSAAEPTPTEGKVPVETETTEGVGAEARERAFKEPAFFKKPAVAPEEVTVPPPDKFEFADPEQEAAFKGARGLRKPTLFEKAKDFSESIKHKVTRTFEHLPKTAEFAQLQFDLGMLAKQKGVQLENVIVEQKKALNELDLNSYDIFERKVILDSFAADTARGLKIPFGFTLENLPQEIARLDAEIAKQPRLQAALQKRKEVAEFYRDEYIAAMKGVGLDLSEKLNDPNYFRHQVLDHIEASRLTGVGAKLKTPAYRGFLRKKAGTELDINTNYLQAETEVLAKMAYDTQVATTIKNIDARDNIAVRVRAEAKEQGLENWREAIPEGYVVWQPREGNLFYLADTIPAKLAADLESGALKEVGLTEADIKKVLAVGGKRKEFVLKNEIAETLYNLQKKKPQGFLEGLDAKALRAWKVWQLTSPRRYVKYNARNVSGDADAVFIGNPKGFLKSKQSMIDLYNMVKSGGEKSQNLQDYFNRGGMGGTLLAQEIGEIDTLESFKNLVEKKFRGRALPGNIWKSYWNKARVSTDLRETVLRYGNYLSYLEQMQANPEGRPDNFGASIPEEIMALDDIKDRAYWLSNDLLGAYDRISVAGQAARQYWYPFWSWQEVNFTRYKRFIQNAVNDGRTAETVGKIALKGVKTGTYKSYRIGKFLLKATALWSALQAYNNFLFPELEEKLSKEKRARPHIIFGEDKDGNVITFDRLGAMGDILEWFGLDVAPKFVDDWFKGRMTLKEIAYEMAKSPPNKLIQGLHPFVKTTGELLTRKALFPKAFEPRAIRDNWFHLFRSFGLENEYVALTDKPSKGYAESLTKALIYKSDPEQEAYSEIFNLKNRFLKSINKGGDGFWISPKGNATYNLKLALRYGDEEAAKKYILEYANLGGTPKGLMQSLQRMHPLSGLSKLDKLAFLETLDVEEQGRLELAVKFYGEHLGNLR